MSDEELRSLERAAEEGTTADRLRLADALERAGRGDEALAKLVGGIREAPEDDALRLGSARILEARGDPRGTFVRLQVEAAALGEHDSRRWELELRAEALLGRWREEWLAGVGSLAARYPQDVEFRRGFLEVVTLGVSDFLNGGEALFRREPVRELQVHPQTGEGAILAECAALRWVRELVFGHATLPPRELEALLRSPHLARLERLKVWSNTSGDGLALAIARGPRLTGLRVLEIAAPIGDMGAKALADSAQLPEIARLKLFGREQLPLLQDVPIVLDGHTIAAESLVALLSRRRALEELTITVGREAHEAGLSVEEVARVLSQPGATRVKTLSIFTRDAGNEELSRVLATSEPLSGLTRLAFHGTLGDDGAAALARGRFESLRHLRLAPRSLGSAGARSLAASAFVGQLRSLDLHQSALRDEGTIALAPALSRNLLELDLASNGIDVTGVRALADSPAADSIVKLNLSGNPIGRDGVAALVKSNRWESLRFLDLGQAGIDAAGAELLLDWPRLKDLAQLRLDHNDLREHEDVWYDQGAVVGSTPADPVVARIRSVLGHRLSIER